MSGFGSGGTASVTVSGSCPCGGMPRGATVADCCGPVVSGERQAATAEALMRSRYTAYVLGDGDHLFRTWHPRTRTDDAENATADTVGRGRCRRCGKWFRL